MEIAQRLLQDTSPNLLHAAVSMNGLLHDLSVPSNTTHAHVSMSLHDPRIQCLPNQLRLGCPVVVVNWWWFGNALAIAGWETMDLYVLVRRGVRVGRSWNL